MKTANDRKLQAKSGESYGEQPLMGIDPSKDEPVKKGRPQNSPLIEAIDRAVELNIKARDSINGSDMAAALKQVNDNFVNFAEIRERTQRLQAEQTIDRDLMLVGGFGD